MNKDNANKAIFLTGIGMADILFLMIRFIIDGLKNLIDPENKYNTIQYLIDPESKLEFSHILKLTWPIMVPLRYTFYSCSLYLTILLTLERYIAVYQKQVTSFWKSKIFFSSFVLFPILYNFPFFFKRSWGKDVNGTTTMIYTTLAKNPFFAKHYETWIFHILNFVLPLVCLIVFNILIFQKVLF